jgi:hypothetical protein
MMVAGEGFLTAAAMKSSESFDYNVIFRFKPRVLETRVRCWQTFNQ